MTHKAEMIESTTSVLARDALTNNNHFKAASFQPKKGVDFGEIAKAAGHFQSTFGAAVKELALSPVVAEIRERIADEQDALHGARDLLVQHRFPGAVVLDGAIAQVRAIQRGTEEAAIAEFNASHQTLKDGIRRAAEIESKLTSGAIADVEQARRTLHTQWRTLDGEADLDAVMRDDAELLADLLERETFFRELGEIERCAASIRAAYDERFRAGLAEKVDAYQKALAQLFDMPVWLELSPEAKEDIAGPLHVHADDTGVGEPSLAQLHADRDACITRLNAAIARAYAIVEGDRISIVNVQPYFRGGVDDTEQLESALTGLREECERLLADGKKIVVT
jgi:hypothetical protein